jgi:hypothetical protein
MSERIDSRLQDSRVRHDTRLLGDFARIYCKGVHADRERAPLTSRGVELGVYGQRAPEVCEECAGLLVYAEQRRALCPQDKPGAPKPFCSTVPPTATARRSASSCAT